MKFPPSSSNLQLTPFRVLHREREAEASWKKLTPLRQSWSNPNNSNLLLLTGARIGVVHFIQRSIPQLLKKLGLRGGGQKVSSFHLLFLGGGRESRAKARQVSSVWQKWKKKKNLFLLQLITRNITLLEKQTLLLTCPSVCLCVERREGELVLPNSPWLCIDDEVTFLCSVPQWNELMTDSRDVTVQWALQEIMRKCTFAAVISGWQGRTKGPTDDVRCEVYGLDSTFFSLGKLERKPPSPLSWSFFYILSGYREENFQPSLFLLLSLSLCLCHFPRETDFAGSPKAAARLLSIIDFRVFAFSSTQLQRKWVTCVLGLSAEGATTTSLREIWTFRGRICEKVRETLSFCPSLFTSLPGFLHCPPPIS